METDFGICEYIGDRSFSFPCVLKELYTDFVVQEILYDQTVLRIATVNDVSIEVKNEEEKGVDETVSVPDYISAETVAILDSINVHSGPIIIPTEDYVKEQRTGFHNFVRERYQGNLGTETKLKNIEVIYRGVNSKNRKRKRWNSDMPDYLHFTMAKENKDTSYALGVLAKFLNVPVNSLRTHGIKDRRAVTSQRVSCKRMEKEKLMSLNSRLRGILVYDFEYRSDEVKMGGHWGNRFNIVLRTIPKDAQSIIEERVNDLSVHGFLNYYGTQRFGSCDTNTAEVGKLILQRKWEAAIQVILCTDRDNTYQGTVGDAVRCWKETKDAKKALAYLRGGQAFATIEAMIFKCLSHGGTWQMCITEALPRNIRSLYVHAYQSLLWNKVVSRRMVEHGLKVIDDDLGSNGQALPEGSTIFDIHVPLPGENTNFKSNYASEWFSEMLSADELTNTAFSSLEDRFALGEMCRPVFIRPGDVKYKFINYTDPRAFLQSGLATSAIKEEEQIGDLLVLRVEFNLPSGAYATVALRQITGSDMGKKTMKNLSESNRKENEKQLIPSEKPIEAAEDQVKIEVKEEVVEA